MWAGGCDDDHDERDDNDDDDVGSKKSEAMDDVEKQLKDALHQQVFDLSLYDHYELTVIFLTRPSLRTSTSCWPRSSR